MINKPYYKPPFCDKCKFVVSASLGSRIQDVWVHYYDAEDFRDKSYVVMTSNKEEECQTPTEGSSSWRICEFLEGKVEDDKNFMELLEFVRECVKIGGKYDYNNGKSIVSDAYKLLNTNKRHL